MTLRKKYRSITVLGIAWLTLVASAPNAFAWGDFEGGHHPQRGGNWARPRPEEVHRSYVDHGRGGGCVGCGVGIAAVAGLLGGAVLGAAIAGSSAPPPPDLPPPPPTMVVEGLAPGMEVTALPPGCRAMNVNGVNYYECGPTWYQPYFGGNGVYYTVVNAP